MYSGTEVKFSCVNVTVCIDKLRLRYALSDESQERLADYLNIAVRRDPAAGTCASSRVERFTGDDEVAEDYLYRTCASRAGRLGDYGDSSGRPGSEGPEQRFVHNLLGRLILLDAVRIPFRK